MDEQNDPNGIGRSDPSAFDFLGDEAPVTEFRGPPSVKALKKTARPAATPSAAEPEMSSQELATRLENGAAAVYAGMIVSSGLGNVGDADVMVRYLRSMTGGCVDSQDPLQQLLMHQIILCYHRLSTLHALSAQAHSPEAAIQYNSAAVKLQAELRKSMLTLRELQRVSLETGVLVRRTVTVQKKRIDTVEEKTKHRTV